MKRKTGFVIKCDSRKLMKVATILSIVGLLFGVGWLFLRNFVNPCYTSTYVLLDQQLSDAGGRCKNCLVIHTNPIGSQAADGYFFETEHKLLPIAQGSLVKMRWCSFDDGWLTRGVSKA